MEQLYKKIAALGKKYGADRILLFGSRARGDHRERSDIDLAVYGMPEDQRAAFWSELEDLPTLLDFDIVHISAETSQSVMESIERDGVVLMSKLEEKYNKLQKAVQRLQEAIQDYEKNPLDSIRDGVIQRFEFCVELTWKTLREYLIDQGYTEINSPKAVIRQAYADQFISQEDAWLSLLNDRNTTSHLYDESAAEKIYNRIVTVYLGLFEQVLEKMA